jgi:quercetin dioxygenase-like cupin family protein
MMDLHEVTQLRAARIQAGRSYLEFLRVPSLSAGLYELPPGGVDPQQPHAEDEVYYVICGQGMVRVGAEDQPVAAGTVLFVPSGVPHHFHTITAALSLLVFFAPPEGTRGDGPGYGNTVDTTHG